MGELEYEDSDTRVRGDASVEESERAGEEDVEDNGGDIGGEGVGEEVVGEVERGEVEGGVVEEGISCGTRLRNERLRVLCINLKRNSDTFVMLIFVRGRKEKERHPKIHYIQSH